ncbi:HAMP domain-containing histidine kinase [bacterium]|nr:HAMP domain-containing histidine kinase [bacterium]MCI0605899.1 HAMP domain-containing histidine kinase [bacterium]
MSPKKKVLRVSLQQTVDSVIVHDMKNLAFRLSALLQNMDENYENPMFKQSIAEILNDTVRKMDAIVKRFRENQQQVVVKLRVDVNHILKKLLEDLPQRRSRDLNLDLSFEEVPPIWGDPFYLHNAFHSLIENGIEAMPDGGTLRVHCGLTRERKREKILIEISDTGMGMSESFVQNELFNPFTTTKEKGLGLGLFTSQQIFALHGGKIKVMSTPGSGTTFRITLPVEENGTQENSHH